MPKIQLPAFIDELRFDTNVRALFEVIPHLHFFIKDRAGRLTFCNSTHRHGLFRFKNATAIYGKENFDFFPSVLAAAFAEDDRYVMKTGKPIMERIELNITNSGVLSWFCTTKIPARNVKGKIVGLIGISRRLDNADENFNEFNLLMPSIEYIHEHRSDKMQLSALARLCHMTETTFRRKFKTLFRMTPMKFIVRMRIHDACSRLTGGSDSVGEVAYRSGFEDQNYFARQFRLMMGTTPTEFRKSYRNF